MFSWLFYRYIHALSISNKGNLVQVYHVRRLLQCCFRTFVNALCGKKCCCTHVPHLFSLIIGCYCVICGRQGFLKHWEGDRESRVNMLIEFGITTQRQSVSVQPR